MKGCSLDDLRFDRLAKNLANQPSRRSFLKGLGKAAIAAVGIGGPVGANVWPRTGDAASCRAPAQSCTSNGDCCSGICGPKDSRGRRTCLCSDSSDCKRTHEFCMTAVCTEAGICGIAPDFGRPCDDGNLCTSNTVCQPDGTCGGGTSRVCSPLDDCHIAGICDPATGICSNPPGNEGEGCNDGNMCTRNTRCTAGVCAGGEELDCSGDNPCIDYSCDPIYGCIETPKDAGVSCSDGNLCNGNEICDGAGACVAGTPLQPCPECQACNPSTGQCVPSTLANGTACASNGDHCFGTYVCQDGICAGVNPTVCTPLNQCRTAGTCEPSTGVCSSPHKDDNIACMLDLVPGTCQGGDCVSIYQGTCADGANSCGASGIVECNDHAGWCFITVSGAEICAAPPEGADSCVKCTSDSDCPAGKFCAEGGPLCSCNESSSKRSCVSPIPI
jgi:hypothetical protein